MRAESNSEHDLVAWDAAPTERFEHPFPHVAEEETSLEDDRDEEEDMDATQPQQVRAGIVETIFCIHCWFTVCWEFFCDCGINNLSS